MKKNKKHKTYLLITLIVVCIFLMLGFGYALLSQNLDIKGTGTMQDPYVIE